MKSHGSEDDTGIGVSRSSELYRNAGAEGGSGYSDLEHGKELARLGSAEKIISVIQVTLERASKNTRDKVFAREMESS